MANEGIANKLTVRLGKSMDVELDSFVPDLKGADLDEIREVLEQDVSEARVMAISQFKLTPYADAADLAEWDRDTLLAAWPAMYAGDGQVPSCPAANAADAAGDNDERMLDRKVVAARMSLRAACRGCATQLASTASILDHAVKTFGEDSPINLGKYMDITDFTWVGSMCGFYPKKVGQLRRALQYAQDQVRKANAVAEGGVDTAEIESQLLHVGTMTMLAQELAEFTKVSLYAFSAAANVGLADVAWYPLPMWTGRGMLDNGKKAVVFVGDDFLPAYQVVERLKETGATEKYEVCGIGQAADDLPRFYDRGRWVGPMVRVKKLLRTGAFDLIVGSNSCMDVDLANEAKRTQSRFIWTGTAGVNGLADRSGESAKAISKDVIAGADAWVKDPNKAGEVIQRVLEGLGNRTQAYVMDEVRAKVEASRCRDNCDLCTYACPNAVMISRGIKAVKKGEGLKALAELDKKCCLYGECDKACPEKVAISDVMVSAFAQKAASDRFVFRGGRGGATRGEAAANDYTSTTGNSPGWFGIVGCGRTNPDDVQWMANEIASRNGIVVLAGCAAGDAMHYYDPEEQKWLAEKYPFWLQPRSAANYGGCSACNFLPPVILKNSRSGAGVTSYANFVETVAVPFDRFACNTIVWGAAPERMFAIANGIARTGAGVVVGPISGHDWSRFMAGNKWDWAKYWVYEALGQGKKYVEPSPTHLIMPVETREEAVAMACCLNVRPAQGFRTGFLEGWLDTHRAYFGELPDNWHRFVRSPSDLPIASRIRLLADLQANHGWDIQGITAKRMPHPDGRMLDQRQYVKEYGAAGSPSTRVPRLRLRPLHDRKQ